MKQMQDEQLFGAPAGIIEGINLAVGLGDCELKSVTFHVHLSMRRDPITLRVYVYTKEQVAEVVGMLTPLTVKVAFMTANSMRANLWRIHNRCGRLGYEVKMTGAGKPPN